MKFFSDPNEIIKFSRKFVGNRIDSLEKDVRYCLRENNNHKLSNKLVIHTKQKEKIEAFYIHEVNLPDN